MALDDASVRTIANAYTAAWNSGSPEAVSEFYAEDGRIVINRGWPLGTSPRGVAQMAAGFFADTARPRTPVRRRSRGWQPRRLPVDLHRDACVERTRAPCLRLGGVGPRRRQPGQGVSSALV